MQELAALGWTASRRAELDAIGDASLVPARVAAVERGRFLLFGLGDPRWAAPPGRLEKHAASALELPTIGDWVTTRDEGQTIERVLSRSSCFVRKAAGREAAPQLVAANVDYVLVVSAIGDDLSARRMQRYAAAAWAGGAEPILVVSKCDRPHDRRAILDELEAAVPGATIALVSALVGDGLDELRRVISAPCTIVLVGSSGVGKSTLLNRWLGEERQRTAEVRATDDKGRHTTTRRDLVVTAGGLGLIDTPGMRELGLWDADPGISMVFADIEELAEKCRFRDCAHASEPGCAVTRALAQGLLPEERLASYRNLLAESAQTASRARTGQETRAIRRVQRQRQKLHKKLGLKDD